MKLSKIVLFTGMLAAGLLSCIKAEDFIFDVGNVLLEANGMVVGNKVGIDQIIAHVIKDGQNPFKLKETLKNRVFEVLELTGGAQQQVGTELRACSDDNRVLPQIMCDWLAGKLSGKQIYQKADAKIKELSKKRFFKSKHERRVIERTIKAMFDPEILGQTMQPIRDARDIVKACFNKRDAQGNSRHRLFILSNMDTESFEHIINNPKNKKIFKYFKKENVVLSGAAGLIKPHKSIYEYTLKKYNLNPTNCVFIDDRIENIHGAQACGIRAYHCTNHKQLMHQLKRDGLV